MARRVVLHQELSGGAIPVVHQKKAGEEGKLVVGSCRLVEQVRGYLGGASEACAAWPRWVAGLPYLLPPLSCPISGEKAADMGVLWPDGSRSRVAGGVAEG